jgi:hypothetical protein
MKGIAQIHIFYYTSFSSSKNEKCLRRICRENVTLFCFENRVVYKIMLKSTVGSDRSQMTILCMRIARWKPKAINTNSEYVRRTAFSTVTLFA